MGINTIDQLNEFDIRKYRSSLLPKWIKIFSWIFFITGFGIPIVLIIPVFVEGAVRLSFLGFSSNTPYNADGLLIVLFFALCAIVAFGLLWCKNWGVLLALWVGIAGLLMVVINAFLNNFNPLPLEPIFQIPFLIKMYKIKNDWKSIQV